MKVEPQRCMHVTVLKPSYDTAVEKPIATYHQVEGIKTTTNLEGELCYVLFLYDEPAELWPTFPVADYNLRVE